MSSRTVVRVKCRSFPTDTTFKLGKCRVIGKVGGEADASDIWSCKGFNGKPEYEIVYCEGDLRGIMPVGIDALQRCSTNQTFSGFNSAGTAGEWRLKDGKPVAAIVRWTVSYDREDSTLRRN
jgi:hypothetical protein